MFMDSLFDKGIYISRRGGGNCEADWKNIGEKQTFLAFHLSDYR